MATALVSDGLHGVGHLGTAQRLGQPYDAVVLDLGLPGMGGLEVLTRMRQRGDTTPVLVLTARSATDDRIRGLEAGADDYLPKPFDIGELVARLRAIARRRDSIPVTSNVGNLHLDTATGTFFIELRSSLSGSSLGTVNRKMLALSSKPHQIMESLFRRAGAPVAKDFLMSLDEEGMTAEAIDIHVSRIRKKLKDSGSTAVIKTHYGLGYALEADTV